MSAPGRIDTPSPESGRARSSEVGAIALARGEWRARQERHEARVDALVAAHLDRRANGVRHPVEDFLWTYYRLRPGQLRRWHPGAGIRLLGATERSEWAYYRVDARGAEVDLPSYLTRRGERVRAVRDLLAATASRPAQWGCFGLHEWAMVYRLGEAPRRHPAWPLRLGTAGTDAVVEAHQLRCSHDDAYRFFTDAARPRNALRPTRDTKIALEQPGCLHAAMDLYKWAYQLSPAIGSALVLDSLNLARVARELDMRASPYDLRNLGYEPIPVETTAGKAAYVAQQRVIAERAAALRTKLQTACDALLAAATPQGDAG